MTAEGVSAARSAAKQLSLREAEMILGIESSSGATWEEIMKVRWPLSCWAAPHVC